MLANDVRIVCEKVRADGARESIQDLGARPFDEVADHEPPASRRPGAVLGVGIDLAPGLFEDGMKPPGARLKGTHMRA